MTAMSSSPRRLAVCICCSPPRLFGFPANNYSHAIVVDKTRCRWFETWDTRVRAGTWRAGSGATWSLAGNELRPDGWTSADAAGLPILPGLLRWNEVSDGYVDHAVRFTTDITSGHYLWPARHHAGSQDSLDFPPMGARFRLRSSFPSAGYGPVAQAVIAAMKRHGLVLADNGSPWSFQGERNGALAGPAHLGVEDDSRFVVRCRGHLGFAGLE